MPLFRKNISIPTPTSSLFRSFNDDLRRAAYNGDTITVLDVIKKGAKFIPNKEGRTALHLAAVQNHMDVVKILIEHGCDLNSQDKLGYTATHRACLEGHTEMVRLILDTNMVNVDKQDFVQENTALHDAAWHGYSSIVEMLLLAKSNVYVRNKTGSTALHLACQNGHNKSARLLVQHGCKPDVKDKYDDTPLHTSCRYIHAGVIRVLLSANANANEQNKNGDTPLHLACNLGQKKISRMLLDANAKVDLKNKQGETPIDIAVRKQLMDLVDILKNAAKAQKLNCGNGIFSGTVARTSRSKIRERLQAAKDAGSTWQLLFQDWTPYSGSTNQNTNSNGQQRVCPHLYPQESGFTNPVISPNLKPIEENGEQYCVDLSGNIRKAPIACYCAPFFYHLAKHNNDAHLELLEEIDACQNNLSNEISDLRQVTERKIDDLNRAVRCQRPSIAGNERSKPGWHRLLSTTKRRLYCAAAAAAAVTTPTNPQQSLASTFGRLVRSKSESEIETDIERGRTHAMADELVDSDSASNASDDLYFDRRFLLRSRCGIRPPADFCGSVSHLKEGVTPSIGHVINMVTNSANQNAARQCTPSVPSSTPLSTVYADNSLDVMVPRSAMAPSNVFDETVRQFNKLESDSFHESSCTTPTTTGSCSGMSSSRHCTPDTSIRSSIYSTQSVGSYLSSSQLSNSKSLQPSLDSGYGGSGIKVDHENHNQVPFQLQQPQLPLRQPQASGVPQHPLPYQDQPQAKMFQTPKVPDDTFWRQNEIRMKRQPIHVGKIPLKAEAETQTDTANNNARKPNFLGNGDMHEYTELECMLRTTATKMANSDFAFKRRVTIEKPPPVLPIPPPPRKPLPPLPIGQIDSSPPKRTNQQRGVRYNPNNAYLSTNV